MSHSPKSNEQIPDEQEVITELKMYFGSVKKELVPPKELHAKLQAELTLYRRKKRASHSFFRFIQTKWFTAALSAVGVLVILFFPTQKAMIDPDEAYQKHQRSSDAGMEKDGRGVHSLKKSQTRERYNKKVKLQSPWKKKGSGVFVESIHSHQINGRHNWKHKTSDEDILYPGDLMKFSYQLSDDFQMMIVSVDQNGKVSIFVPFGERSSMLVKAGKGSLPVQEDSLELDDFIGKERIFVLYSKHRFWYKDVKRSLQRVFQEKKVLSKVKLIPGTWKIAKSILINKKNPEQLEKP